MSKYYNIERVMLSPTLVLVTACVQQLCARHVARVHMGVDDVDGKFPYVVALVSTYRHCTGTLIAPNWVITAAHCFWLSTHIQYANMTVHSSDSEAKSEILNMIEPPSSYFIWPDIGLLYVRTVPVKVFAVLSGVDYTSLIGLAVQYAGFGFTHKMFSKNIVEEIQLDQVRPLQLGEGVVTPCEWQEMRFSPYICISPKCSNHDQQPLSGDSGGPLLLQGRVVGVHVGSPHYGVTSYYTPTSPYLTWISTVMNSPTSFKNESKPNFDNNPIPWRYLQMYNMFKPKKSRDVIVSSALKRELLFI